MRLLGWGGSCKGIGGRKEKGGGGGGGGAGCTYPFWFKYGGKMCCERSLTVEVWCLSRGRELLI